jgi:23S rRNA pseudouridine955/2504/2580 synthase/23S rRNA pseudouridine1911/1915/1917 synthase
MERKPRAVVGRAESGAALIDWLSGRFTYLSADAWRTMLEEGRVGVDGRAAGAGRKLVAGETVAFDPPRYDEPEVDPWFSVVAEEGDFLIVDKSGNLPCHPAGRYFEHSLWYLLRESRGEVRIATRLDRETSGLVLACTSSSSAAFAQRLLAAGSVEKEYLVLVHGSFPESLETVGYLTEDSMSEVRKKRRFVAGGPIPEGKKVEACSTRFCRIGRIGSPAADPGRGEISLLRALPTTGRTHQIRATLCSLGFPIVGDKLYGLDEGCFLRFAAGALEKEDLARLVLPNQALHCSGLSFLGESGERVGAVSTPRWGGLCAEFAPQLPLRT